MPKDFAGVMSEWGKGQLHSGSKTGPKVTNQKQAEAIAFSEDAKLKGSEDHHRKMVVRHALGLAHHMTKLRKAGKVSA